MNSITVSRNGKDTVLRIAEGVDARVYALYHRRDGTKFWRKDFRRISFPTDEIDININWAYSGSTCNSRITYNEPAAIALSSDKAACRMALREAGVPIPKTSVREEVLSGMHLPCICRTRRHQAGSGFKMAYTTKELFDAIREGYYYFSEEYKKEKEYRVHVAHGKVLVMQEKTPINESSRSNIIWNHAGGEFVFMPVAWSSMPIEVSRVAIDSVKAVGLDFGAVDVLYSDSEDDRAVVCEINTSPALADYTLGKYQKYFNWLLGSETKREHYDCSGFTVQKSFAIKNYQLEV